MKTLEEKQSWIPVTEKLPEERTSTFAKLKGTAKWKIGMFETCSDDVLVTIKYGDEIMKKCQVAKTIDGKWKNGYLRALSSTKVIAWMPFPEPMKGGDDDGKG